MSAPDLHQIGLTKLMSSSTRRPQNLGKIAGV